MATFSRKGRLGQIRIWKIVVIGDQVHRWSGQKGRAMTHTYDTPGSVGKGTKAFVPARERALERALYLTKKKEDAGYREVDPNFFEPLDGTAAIIDINWKSFELPRNFEVGKPLDPKSKRDLKRREDLVASDNHIITLKEDGLCYVVMISDNNVVQIYSRKMEYFTDHFPYIVRGIKEMHFPARTILTCEFVIKTDGRDDRKAIQSLKGKADRTAKKQESPLMRPTAVVLNSPYWAGEPVLKTQTVMEWMSTINDFFEKRMESGSFRRHIRLLDIRPMETLYGDFAQCKQHVIDNEHEGLVIYDKTSCFGDRAFNFRGSTERTPCFKWKPYFECDCLVVFNPDGEFSDNSLAEVGGQYGTAGKVRGLPKNVALFQFDGTDSDRKLIHLSNCGSGFSIEQREEILKLAKDRAGYVGVAEIRYASRFFKSRGDDTNALLEPIFKGFHPDKVMTEAVESRLRG